MSETVFKDVDDYLSMLFNLEDKVLKETEESIVEHDMPEHSVSANQGQFLYMLAKICQAKNVVEIGTLGGYSTIWLGRALAGSGKLVSIEMDKDFAEVARRNVTRARLSDVVEIRVGKALSILEQMDFIDEPLDLFFMDADKPNYIAYFDWAIRHSRKGSLIIADNVIREGKVMDEESTDPKVLGVRAYNEMLSKDDRVISTVLQQVGCKAHDGIAISMVK